MTISGIGTVYKVHPTGGGQKHAKQPRHEHHRPHDEQRAHDANEPAIGPNAAGETLADGDHDVAVGKRIDVSA